MTQRKTIQVHTVGEGAFTRSGKVDVRINRSVSIYEVFFSLETRMRSQDIYTKNIIQREQIKQRLIKDRE